MSADNGAASYRTQLVAVVAASVDEGWVAVSRRDFLLKVVAENKRVAQTRCTFMSRLICQVFGGHDSRAAPPSLGSDGRYWSWASYRGGRPAPLWDLVEEPDGSWVATIVVERCESDGDKIVRMFPQSLPTPPEAPR